MRRRIIALTLSMIMLLCLLPTAVAEQDSWGVIGNICGTNWDTDFSMEEIDENVWEIGSLDLHEGEMLKVRFGDSWDLNYGISSDWDGSDPVVCEQDGRNLVIPADDLYTVTLTLSDPVYITLTNSAGETVLPRTEPDPELSFKTQALALEGKIGLIFFMDLSCLSDDEKEASYMTFEISGAGEVSADPVPFDANNTNADGTYYGFTCYVASIQMADTITATFHYGNDQTITKDYSIKQYIETFWDMEDQFDVQTVNLVHTLADYGHHVQAFLADYKGWDLGESGDYAEMDTFCSEYYDGYDNIIHEFEEFHKEIYRDFRDENIVKAPYTVVLDSDTAIRVYFTPTAGFNGNVSAVLDGNTGDETALERGSDGRYMVEIANIPAHLLGETHTIVVHTGDNCFGQGSSAYTRVNVSAMSYVYSILTSDAYADNMLAKNAVSSLYAYWHAAVAYRDAHPAN